MNSALRDPSPWLVVAVVAVMACKPEPEPDPNSLAAIEAQGPPHTPDCGSWDAAAFEGLDPLPAGPHVPAFDQVWKTVGLKHYDPTLACLDWVTLRASTATNVANAGADAEVAYAVINEMLGLLGQSHLVATPPTRAARADRSEGPASVPITIRWIFAAPDSTERQLVVVEPALGGHESGIPRGAVVTGIDGEVLEPLVAEFAAGVVDPAGHPAAQAFEVARGVGGLLDCPAGGSLRIEFLDPTAGDAARALDVPCFLPDGERLSLGNLRDLPTRVDTRMIAGDGAAIGYLGFNLWMLPMLERIESGLATLRAAGLQGLVIDLRGNPGGVGAMSIPVARMFLQQPASLGRLQMREFDQEFKVDGNPDAFAGPIAILVDEGTASTSEIFAMGLRDVGRVTIVGGGPSSGKALPSMIETLPDGGLIQYVVGDYHSAKGEAAEGMGVAPQIVVAESRTDFVNGRDPVLDAAVAWLREQLATPSAAPPSP